MENYKLAEVMMSKIRPDFGNKKWLRAYKLLSEIKKKSTMNIDSKKKDFVYYVDEIYKDLDNE